MTNNCIFCKVVAKKVPAEILFENDEILIFKDIKPVTTHHYLTIPKEHIKNINSLIAPEHNGLLERLVLEGKKLLEQQGGDLNDIRLGFHVPPFNSIEHLHLHVISPASQMGFLHRMMFKPHTWWFANVEEIQAKLQKLADETEHPPKNKL